MDINIFYNNGVLNKNKLKESWIIKNLPDLYKDISNFNNNIEVSRYSQLIWHYINNMNNYPICGHCSKFNKRFDGFENGYKPGCTKNCAILLSRPSSNETRRINTLNKWGVEHTTQLKSVQDKMKKTNLERFGVDFASKSRDIMDKMRKTNLERFGVELPLQNSKILERQQKTMIERYGVDNGFKSNLIKDKVRKTIMKNWGVEWITQSNIVKDKIKTKSDNTFVEKLINIYKDTNLTFNSYENGIINFNCGSCKLDFDITSNLLNQRYFKNSIKICTNCNPINNKTSNGHLEIVDFLKEIGIEDITLNRRDLINPYELDIFLPGFNIAIEYNGVYWHSELLKDKSYHNMKMNFCVSENIKLIQIWEDDWINKKDIIKSILINQLGYVKSIGARKCEIRNVGSNDSKIFLNENHIQGWCVSKLRYGLYYNDELVSLLTMGGNRITMGGKKKNDEFEILRFCNKLNFNIVGGFTKLWNNFLKYETPSKVISYCDLDLFNGYIYKKINMKLESTSINYWWCDGRNRWNRWCFRKDILIKNGFDPNKTSDQIMRERGWFKCWGSGNNKYVIYF